jgi:hypothetical protein
MGSAEPATPALNIVISEREKAKRRRKQVGADLCVRA